MKILLRGTVVFFRSNFGLPRVEFRLLRGTFGILGSTYRLLRGDFGLLLTPVHLCYAESAICRDMFLLLRSMFGSLRGISEGNSRIRLV